MNEKASNFLLNYKPKQNRSKVKNLTKFSFQNYLKSDKLSTKEKKLLFSLRTRSIDVKTNYRNKYQFDMHCKLCKNVNEEESEIHLLKCDIITKNISHDINLTSAKYENIFSENVEDQIQITKIFAEIFKLRNILLNQ